MPAEQRGHARKLPSGKWQLRYRDRAGAYHSGGAFGSKTEALNHYRDAVEPELNGRPAARRDLTLQELADTFLDRHSKVASDRTIRTLRGRLSRPLDEFGTVRLDEFERMADDGAAFAATLPERYRYSVVSALRQTCAAGVRWGYITKNPAKLSGRNPQPPPRGARIYTPVELRALVAELGTPVTVPQSRSPPLQGSGPLSGRSSSDVTSTGTAGSSRCAAPRRPAHAVRCR